MSTRGYWQRFARLIKGVTPGTAVLGSISGRNMNKAHRIVRREERRTHRRQCRELRDIIVSNTPRSITGEEVGEIVNLMKDTYQPVAICGEHEISPVGPDQGIGSASDIPHSELLKKVTRDELRKAFSAAGVTGFRNARREQLEEAFYSCSEIRDDVVSVLLDIIEAKSK